MFQSQIINNLEKFKQFFACRIVLAADHQQPGNNQKFFRLQNCLGRKSSLSRKHSKTFSLAELSWPQIIDTPKIFKQFFTCRYVLVANHRQLEKTYRLFRLQKYLSRKSLLSRKNSMIFSPAELSQPQIINIPKIFKDSFACRIVLAVDHRYPENIQTGFHLQKYLSRKSSLSRKNSKIFSPAKLSLPQIIDAPEIFKHFFTCRYVLVANHQQLRKIQTLFCLQNSLRRRPSTTWK